MREILFRGKRFMDGEFVDGSLFIDEKKDKHEILAGYVNYRVGWEVDPETVGQYTGLTDSNGQKIFEGDIIRYADIHDYSLYLESLEYPEEYDGEVYDADIVTDVVVWCDEHDYPAFDLRNHDFECNGLSQILCGDYTYEVIGNIHDNPELLKGGAVDG